MKILHTADWHIGKRLAGQSLIEDQEFVLEQICDYIENNEIDVVVIAGDIYDRVSPSQAAMNTVNKYLKKINLELEKPVVMISGNHDGKPYLDGNSEWYRHTNLFVNTKMSNAFEKLAIGSANFYLLPYIDVPEARAFYKDKEITSFEHAYQKVIEQMKEDLDPNETNILVGHLFVRDGKESESEEKMSVGLMEEVRESIFGDFHYTLIGHLHHPFAIKNDRIHYSGSLLKYSFDEWKQPKGFKVIDTETNTVEFKKFNFLRDVIECRGSYKEIVEDRIEIGPRDAYYKFILTDMESATEPMATLKSIYPNTLVLTREVENFDYDLDTINVSEQSDTEILSSFIEKFKDRNPLEYELKKFDETMREVVNETD